MGVTKTIPGLYRNHRYRARGDTRTAQHAQVVPLGQLTGIDGQGRDTVGIAAVGQRRIGTADQLAVIPYPFLLSTSGLHQAFVDALITHLPPDVLGGEDSRALID